MMSEWPSESTTDSTRLDIGSQNSVISGQSVDLDLRGDHSLRKIMKQIPWGGESTSGSVASSFPQRKIGRTGRLLVSPDVAQIWRGMMSNSLKRDALSPRGRDDGLKRSIWAKPFAKRRQSVLELLTCVAKDIR